MIRLHLIHVLAGSEDEIDPREECFCVSTPPIDYLPFCFAVLARDLFRFILSLLPFLFLFSSLHTVNCYYSFVLGILDLGMTDAACRGRALSSGQTEQAASILITPSPLTCISCEFFLS